MHTRFSMWRGGFRKDCQRNIYLFMYFFCCRETFRNYTMINTHTDYNSRNNGRLGFRKSTSVKWINEDIVRITVIERVLVILNLLVLCLIRTSTQIPNKNLLTNSHGLLDKAKFDLVVEMACRNNYKNNLLHPSLVSTDHLSILEYSLKRFTFNVLTMNHHHEKFLSFFKLMNC